MTESKVTEDASIEDFCVDMDRYWKSPRHRLTMLRLRVRFLWLGLICALTNHKPKQDGYWDAWTGEGDSWWACERCGKHLS